MLLNIIQLFIDLLVVVVIVLQKRKTNLLPKIFNKIKIFNTSNLTKVRLSRLTWSLITFFLSCTLLNGYI